MANDPARVDDELDVVLDGRRHLYRSELGPEVQAARLLAEELRAIELPPGVAERHVAAALQQARGSSARARGRTLWRALGATVAAAAIFGIPASLASGHALPGEPLYPLKRTIEAADLAFTRDPCKEADLELRIAHTRMEELSALLRNRDGAHVVGALRAVQSSVQAADVAVAKALGAEGRTRETAALQGELGTVRGEMRSQLTGIVAGADPAAPRQAVVTASSILATATPAPTTTAPPAGPPAPQTTTTAAPPTTHAPPPTTTIPPTTAAPTTSPPTTTAPPPTEPSTTTAPTKPAPSLAKPSGQGAGTDVHGGPEVATTAP
jgi:Domain of unknown function (DUF5667)